MRSQLLSLLLLSSCTIILPRFVPESCEEGTPNTCSGDVLLVCAEGFEVEQECSPGVCDPVQLRCDACGDGQLGSAEACDDGNTTSGDGCSNSCALEAVCGNDIVEGAELCDDGDSNSDTLPNACRTDCTLPSCGDGVIDNGEGCDPPGQNSCDASCQLPCNDPAECEDNNACTTNECTNSLCVFTQLAAIDDGDACTENLCDPATGAISNPPLDEIDDDNDCTNDLCADGVITNPPQNDGTPCGGGSICVDGDCVPSVCGDGILDSANEECDDSNVVSGDGCDAQCQSEGACGGAPTAGLANFADTTNGTNELGGSCTGVGFPEQVFTFTPPGDGAGTLLIALVSDTDQGVYVRTDCDDAATEIGCTDEEFGADQGGDAEFLTINNVQSGVPLSIIVDVFHDPTGGFGQGLPGEFVLFVDFTICGDGTVNSNEVCDDANQIDGDGCRSDCQSNETCGNGVLDFQLGEECDDGNQNNNDGCSSLCETSIAAACAAATPLEDVNIGDTRENQSAIDGFCFGPDGPEAIYTFTPPATGTLSLRLDSIAEALIYVRTTCDAQQNDIACVDFADEFQSEFLDVFVQGGVPLFVFVDAHFGEASPFVLLSSFEQCGNNIVGGGEACDDGNLVSGDGCNSHCTSNETCGNGFIDPNEQCDDFNTTDADGCEGNCTFICGAALNPDAALVDESTGHCYVGFDDFQTWDDARAICEDLGGALASITSATENDLLSPFAPFNFWIGLNDQVTEGTFAWVTGEAVSFTDFAPGEPNNGGEQDCVVTTANGWDDDNCGDFFRYACEIP